MPAPLAALVAGEAQLAAGSPRPANRSWRRVLGIARWLRHCRCRLRPLFSRRGPSWLRHSSRSEASGGSRLALRLYQAPPRATALPPGSAPGRPAGRGGASRVIMRRAPPLARVVAQAAQYQQGRTASGRGAGRTGTWAAAPAPVDQLDVEEQDEEAQAEVERLPASRAGCRATPAGPKRRSRATGRRFRSDRRPGAGSCPRPSWPAPAWGRTGPAGQLPGRRWRSRCSGPATAIAAAGTAAGRAAAGSPGARRHTASRSRSGCRCG